MSDHYHEELKEHEGRSYRVRYLYDTDHEAPWDAGDGRGIMINTRDSADKKPGWRPLHTERGATWWFDWAGTVKKAKDEGWGLGPERIAAWTARAGQVPTAGQIAEAAAQIEFDLFRAFLRDEWFYVGIEVTAIVDDEPDETLQDTCWGFETWKDYHLKAAGEMVADLAPRVEAALAQRAATSDRDEGIRKRARDAGNWVAEVHYDAHVDEVDDGYWVTAKIFVPKEG